MSQTKAQLVQPVGIVTGTGINVTGVITATSFVGSGEGLTGVASTDNIITGTAATFNNTVQVNSTLTANSGFTTNAINTNLNVTGVTTIASAKILTGFTTNATNTNLKVTGVGTFAGAVTAASFSGDGSGLTGVANTGFINAEQLTVVGVVTAGTGNVGNLNITKSAAGAGATVGSFTGVSTYYGDGQYLSGVGLSVAPWNYNPDVGDESVPVDTGIGITFNTKINSGSGTATLKIVHAGVAGTTVQSWGISSYTQAGGVTELTFGSLVSDLDLGNTYQLDIPEGFVKGATGGVDYVGTAYTFVTSDAPSGPFVVGRAFAWGNSPYGLLGLNQEQQKSSPTQIPGTTWKNIGRTSYYAYHTSAVKSDGTLWMWGRNTNGQLGQNSGTNAHNSSPVQVPGTTWAASATGANWTLAAKTDGTLWSWGDNGSGQLGHNSQTARSSPTQIPGTNWGYANNGLLAAGAYHAAAIRQDGTLWQWGPNSSGELGQSNYNSYSSPKQVGGDTNWAFCGCDIEKSLGIKTPGALFGWGKNQHGQAAADNSRTARFSPIAIPGTWSVAAQGDDQSFGVKTNGEMWVWGNNNYGQCAQNNNTPGYSSPVQVGGDDTWQTTVSALDSSANRLLALKTDGTLWGWGDGGSEGQLGLGDGGPFRRSSPVQIGATTGDWGQIRNPEYGVHALAKNL